MEIPRRQIKITTLVALRPFKYGDRSLVAGDEFEVNANQTVHLIAFQFARSQTPEEKAKTANGYLHRQMRVTDDVPVATRSTRGSAGKRRQQSSDSGEAADDAATF